MPSLSIEPTLPRLQINTHKASTNTKLEHIKSQAGDEENEDAFDVNQTGTGIALTSSSSSSSLHSNRPTHHPLNIATSTSQPKEVPVDDLPGDVHAFARLRDNVEKQTFLWLEQELLSHFIGKLATENGNGGSVPLLEQEKEEEERITIDPQTLMLMHVLGQEGFQLFVDMGVEVDANLVELLVREVLEEKIAGMIFADEEKATIAEMEEKNEERVPTPPPPPPPVHHPLPSPRKSLDSKREEPVWLEIDTPVVTPPERRSPVDQRRERLTEQPKEQLKERLKVQYLVLEQEEDFSDLDVTLEEKEDDGDEHDLKNHLNEQGLLL